VTLSVKKPQTKILLHHSSSTFQIQLRFAFRIWP